MAWLEHIKSSTLILSLHHQSEKILQLGQLTVKTAAEIACYRYKPGFMLLHM